jgi:DNA-binding NarL/FixJ family response regulator
MYPSSPFYEGDGFEKVSMSLLHHIRSPLARLVVNSSSPRIRLHLPVVAEGSSVRAKGHPKSEPHEAPSVTRRLVEEFVRRPPPGSTAARRLEGVTERELEVLRLVARGLSNAEIAAHCSSARAP